MSKALSPSFVCCYGLARVARVQDLARSVYRSLQETPPNTSARPPGPVGDVRTRNWQSYPRQIDHSRLHGEGYRSYGPIALRWRSRGPRRVRRVMRRTARSRRIALDQKAKPRDGTIITDKVNEMWETDMTQTITIREGRANDFVAVEHANSEVIGIMHRGLLIASRPWSRCPRGGIEASEPSRPGWRVD